MNNWCVRHNSLTHTWASNLINLSVFNRTYMYVCNIHLYMQICLRMPVCICVHMNLRLSYTECIFVYTRIYQPSSYLNWVMAHTSLSHATHMNESWHTHQWVKAHPQIDIESVSVQRCALFWDTGWRRCRLRDASSCRSLSAKKPIIMGICCGKQPMTIRHPTYLCHPVRPPICRAHPTDAHYRTAKTGKRAYLLLGIQAP